MADFNITLGNSSPSSKDIVIYFYNDTERLVDIAILSTILILGIISNPLIIGLYAVQKRRAGDYFVMNMVIMDILIVSCSGPIILAHFARGPILEYEVCRFFSAVGIGAVGSLWSLTAVAITRCFQVCYPTQFALYFKNRHCIGYCCFIWFFCGIVAGGPYLGWGGHSYDVKSLMCNVEYTTSLSYTLFAYIGAQGTSIAVTVISYTLLFLKLHESSKRMGDNLSAESKAKRNQAITSMMLSAVFTAAWSPYCVTCAFDIFYDVTPWMVKYSVYIGLSNSSFNGFLYVLVNRNYRDTFFGLFKRKTSVQPQASLNTATTNVGD